MNLKSLLAAFIPSNNKTSDTKTQTLEHPVLSEYVQHDAPMLSTFESKLKDYYKATYIMYAKLNDEVKQSIAEKYQDYIDIQELRKDILSYAHRKTG